MSLRFRATETVLRGIDPNWWTVGRTLITDVASALDGKYGAPVRSLTLTELTGPSTLQVDGEGVTYLIVNGVLTGHLPWTTIHPDATEQLLHLTAPGAVLRLNTHTCLPGMGAPLSAWVRTLIDGYQKQQANADAADAERLVSVWPRGVVLDHRWTVLHADVDLTDRAALEAVTAKHPDALICWRPFGTGDTCSLSLAWLLARPPELRVTPADISPEALADSLYAQGYDSEETRSDTPERQRNLLTLTRTFGDIQFASHRADTGPEWMDRGGFLDLPPEEAAAILWRRAGSGKTAYDALSAAGNLDV